MARGISRGACPEPDRGPSVVALPGAARERVRQAPLVNTLIARAKLFAAQGPRFAYRSPQLRELEQMARALVDCGDSAETLLLLAALREMPRKQRARLIESLGRIDTRQGRRAWLIARSTMLDIGQEIELWHQIKRYRGVPIAEAGSEVDPQAELHRTPINKPVNAAAEDVPTEGVGEVGGA